MKLLKLLVVPLFWIGVTWAGIKYGPEMMANAKSGKPIINRVKELNVDDKVLGEDSNESSNKTQRQIMLPSPPQSIQQIPDYAKAVAGEVADKALQTGTEAVQQTAGKISENICQQIILELQKQCSSTPTPEPTKSE